MGPDIASFLRSKKEEQAMTLRIGMFCLLSGLCFTISAMGAGHFGWWWLSGAVVAASLVPVVRYGPRGLIGQFGAIFTILVSVGLVCTLSEGALFLPTIKAQMVTALVGGIVVYALAAAVMAALAKMLRLTDAGKIEVAHRSTAMLVPFILLSAGSYVLYYEVFGAITYLGFTKKYYPHAAEEVAALGLWFFGYQLLRGLVMTLAVLPVIYTLRLPRWKAAIAVGIIIWVVGGAGPLLVPNAMMTGTQRFIHIIEIMTQNVALGMTALLLMRPKTLPVSAAERSMTTA